MEIITKLEIPSARHGPNTFGFSFMLDSFNFRIVFSPVKKRSTQMAPTAWLKTVAIAAPRTPISNTKIKIGSSITLMTAPIKVVIMLILEKPCVVIKRFIPRTINTKILPKI